MPTDVASLVGFKGCFIPLYSHFANVHASQIIRKIGDDHNLTISHHANMDQVDEKNGGPNHLRAWMVFRHMKGADLAKELGITPGMVSDLANSHRALNAKWLRRLAPALKTTPGLLLDHDPHDLDNDIIDIWVNASSTERRQISDIAKALVKKTGTEC